MGESIKGGIFHSGGGGGKALQASAFSLETFIHL